MSDEDVPKPEMLEKADAIHRSLVPHGIRLYGDPCPVCRIIALALEEAAQTEADRTTAAIHSLHLQIEAQREALRASEASVERAEEHARVGIHSLHLQLAALRERALNAEASVESLRKERDRLMAESYLHLESEALILKDLESSRAEATKAETWARKAGEWEVEARTMEAALDEIADSSWIPARTKAQNVLAAIRAIRAPRPSEPYEEMPEDILDRPSSPTPPTSPLGTCLIQGRTAHIDDGKCIDWKPEPTPPSEEPR